MSNPQMKVPPFKLPVFATVDELDDDANIYAADGPLIAGSMTAEESAYIIQAINQHPTLQAQNAELKAELKSLVEIACEFYDMECGENGAPAIQSARQLLTRLEAK